MVRKCIQGGQNVRIVRIVRIDFFLTLKLYGLYGLNGLYGFVFKLYGLYGFYPGKFTVFFNFPSFQQIFHENKKKNSRQNEVSLTYFLHSK